MTSTHWERIAAGRYASELHGHILQAIRTDRAHDPTERPYIAIVDRVPIGQGAWSLNQAKTQAIQFVERQNGKTKAARAFSNGVVKPAEPPMIPDPVDVMLAPPPEPVQPDPALVQPDPGLVRAERELVQPDPAPVQTLSEPVQEDSPALAPQAGQLVISGRVTDGDLLNGLNALRSALELLREHAELECTVNLPPVMRL